jgi:hypothetical protein
MRSADGTLLSTANDFSTDQAGNYTLTVTDLSIFSCSSDPVAFTVEEISLPYQSPTLLKIGFLIVKPSS